MNRTLHVIPVGGDEPVHLASGGCWCYPLESAGIIFSHNAKDLREVRERQGIPNPKKIVWVIVEELKKKA